MAWAENGFVMVVVLIWVSGFVVMGLVRMAGSCCGN